MSHTNGRKTDIDGDAGLTLHLTAEVAKWGPILKAAGAKGE
jgi:hypothetical protein